MSATIIDDLRAAFDNTTVLTGADIDGALSHRHGRRSRGAAARGDAAAQHRGVSTFLKLCPRGTRAGDDAGRH